MCVQGTAGIPPGKDCPPPTAPVTPLATHSRARSQSTPSATHSFQPSAALRLEAASEGSKTPAWEEVTVPPGTSRPSAQDGPGSLVLFWDLEALSAGRAWKLGLKLCSPFCYCSRHLTWPHTYAPEPRGPHPASHVLTFPHPSPFSGMRRTKALRKGRKRDEWSEIHLATIKSLHSPEQRYLKETRAILLKAKASPAHTGIKGGAPEALREHVRRSHPNPLLPSAERERGSEAKVLMTQTHSCRGGMGVWTGLLGPGPRRQLAGR